MSAGTTLRAYAVLHLAALAACLLLQAASGAPSDLNPVHFRTQPDGAPVLLVAKGKARGHICVMTEESRVLRRAVSELQE